MSENSSFFNDSVLQTNFSTSDSYTTSVISSPNYLTYSIFLITSTSILLPLCIFILHHGVQHWRERRTSSAAATSHADSFTYHMAILELIGVLRCFLCCYGIYRNDFNILRMGMNLFCFTWFGQLLFHSLLCMERHLAVIHPITYLGLKNERGIRIRNISIGCAWILCCVGTGLMTIQTTFIIVNLTLLLSTLMVVSFCSVSVLCILIRPGPGKQGRTREKVDQSKLRAFYTIVGILAGLLARFAWGLSWALFQLSEKKFDYGAFTSEALISLPSSLVLPLLFLHRKGKLGCCNNNTQRGQTGKLKWHNK